MELNNNLANIPKGIELQLTTMLEYHPDMLYMW